MPKANRDKQQTDQSVLKKGSRMSYLEKKIDKVNIKIDYLEELLERVKANKQDDLIRDIKKKIVLDELKILNKELNKLLKRKDQQ